MWIAVGLVVVALMLAHGSPIWLMWVVVAGFGLAQSSRGRG